MNRFTNGTQIRLFVMAVTPHHREISRISRDGWRTAPAPRRTRERPICAAQGQLSPRLLRVLGETDTLRLVRSGRSPDWLKSKNPACAAAAREAEAEWGKERS